MPARISEKVRAQPRYWNTWNLLVGPTLTSPPAPEFVPRSEGILIAPVSVGMRALSRALPNPRTGGRNEGEQEDAKKERRKKRTGQKMMLQAKLPFR
jgi:hypothetical protein